MAKIYLISPPKIELESFARNLDDALSTGLVPAFQLRLKNTDREEIKIAAKKLRKICAKHSCLFILNDDYEMALEVGANGVHVGENDRKIAEIRKKSPENFIIGASCYDSRHIAMETGEQGADYLSFGAFFPSKTKKSRGKPTTEILEWCNEIIDLPIVAIGGINDQNCHELVKTGANFIAVISYVWDHEKGVIEAIQTLQQSINEAKNG